MSRRLHVMGLAKYANGFQLTLHEDALNDPIAWKKSHVIFVCSMSDLFHADVPFEFIDKIMDTIRATPQHRYQLLTKRAERMDEYFNTRVVPQNAWLGVTCESSAVKHRIDALRGLQAGKKISVVRTITRSIGRNGLNRNRLGNCRWRKWT